MDAKTVRKPERKDVKKERWNSIKKAAAAVGLVLATGAFQAGVATTAGMGSAGCIDIEVRNIPVPPEPDSGTTECLANLNPNQSVEECEVASGTMRSGELLAVGTAGFQSTVVDVNTTKGIQVDGIDGEAECVVATSETLLSGETRRFSLNGKEFYVGVGTLTYDSVGPSFSMTVTPDCYEGGDGGAGGADGGSVADGGAGGQ